MPTERAVLRYLTRDNAGTGAWVPPTGTTAERPTGGNLFTGALRYNATLVTWEGYNGTQWTGLGGGNPWQTFTADGSTGTTGVAGRGYFINTTSAAHTFTLPTSATRGDTIAIKDYAATFGTNKLTIARNGHNIQGVANNSLIGTNRASVVLVYVDVTRGWEFTTESNVAFFGPTYTSATGGTVTTSGNFKIHSFTGDGSFVVSTVGNAAGGGSTVDYLVVAGCLTT